VERPWNIGLNAQVKILVDFLFRSDIIEVSLIAHECGGPIWGMMLFCFSHPPFASIARAGLTYPFAQLR